MYKHTQVLDVMVGQVPEYVNLAYGAVKIILGVQVNYEEMKQNVDKYMGQIKKKFDNIKHLTLYVPNHRLVKAISEMCHYYIIFLAKTIRYYTRRKLSWSILSFIKCNWTNNRVTVKLVKSVTKPWKKLEPFVTSIEQTYGNTESILNFHGHFVG